MITDLPQSGSLDGDSNQPNWAAGAVCEVTRRPSGVRRVTRRSEVEQLISMESPASGGDGRLTVNRPETVPLGKSLDASGVCAAKGRHSRVTRPKLRMRSEERRVGKECRS